MQSTTQDLTEANQFMIDYSVGIIKKLAAGFVDTNINYIKATVINFIYNALENSIIFTTTQQENINKLKENIIDGAGTC
jgi:hypothetical protein